MAVKWKNHIMWTPTIPQEKKFSTVNYYKTSRSMFKPITVKQTLIDWFKDLANDKKILQQKI